MKKILVIFLVLISVSIFAREELTDSTSDKTKEIINKLIVDKDISFSHYFRYYSGIYNYGHLCMVKTPSTSDKYLITYISKAGQSTLKAYRANIYNNNHSYYGSGTNNTTVLNNSGKVSRTRFSGVFNQRTNKFRFIWIEE